MGIQFLNQHSATPPLQGIVCGFHIFKLINPWLFFFILIIPILSHNSKKSSILLLQKPPSPQSSLNPWRKKKCLSLISKLKQDMGTNTASHSHLELLLNMGMELEKYSGSALFCACLQHLQRMLWCNLLLLLLF